MWFALIVPAMLASVWIWPELGKPKLWFGLCLVLLIGALAWLGLDLREFLANREASGKVWVRPLFALYVSSDTPVLPLLLGSLLTGLVCLRIQKVDTRHAEETL